MIFSDLFFLFAFLPAFFLCYTVAAVADRRSRKSYAVTDDGSSQLQTGNMFKNMVLVVFSLIFYAWGEPVYVFLMIFSSFVNYRAGLFISSRQEHRKAALATGIGVNLLILGIFKYLGFFASILAGFGLPLQVPQIALPIGISFYTFQSISYLVDVYR